MVVEITMPQMGADMVEGTVITWFKQVGDEVAVGDIIAEIETDKANVELEAFDAGTMRQHVVAEGDIVPVGEIIALLGGADEALPDVAKQPAAETPVRRTPEAEPAEAKAETPAEVAAPETAVSPASASKTLDGRLRISPVASRIAAENGFDPSNIAGSGPDGRILRRDVEAAIAAKPAVATPPTATAASTPAPSDEIVPLSRMRQTIARRMSQSKQMQPHYYLTLDVDMTDAMAFRKQANEVATDEQRLTVNDLIVKACTLALTRHPKFNGEFSDEGLKLHGQINISIGIALDEGLIAPALLDCASKTLGTIAAEAKDLVERAKTGHLRADEYGSGTFTITNLGSFGVESLIGIINPPQAAILGVGSVMEKAAVHEGEIAIRQIMKLALSADHRVSDGAEGARFIKEIQAVLENPGALAL